MQLNIIVDMLQLLSNIPPKDNDDIAKNDKGKF